MNLNLSYQNYENLSCSEFLRWNLLTIFPYGQDLFCNVRYFIQFQFSLTFSFFSKGQVHLSVLENFMFERAQVSFEVWSKSNVKGGRGGLTPWHATIVKIQGDQPQIKQERLGISTPRHQDITRVILCRLIYIIMSCKPFNDIIMIVCKFLIGLCCLRFYST